MKNKQNNTKEPNIEINKNLNGHICLFFYGHNCIDSNNDK